jgi:transglutaminase-like putative cysteine protease
MLIKVHCDITLTFEEPSPVVLMLNLHPSVGPMICVGERLETVPPLPLWMFWDLYGNRCARVFAPKGHVSFRNSAVVNDSGLPDRQAWTAQQYRVQDLPDDVLHFLLPSRYCEVDSELKEAAWKMFGHLPSGWPLVQTICDYVHRHIRFDYQLARPTRTALEVYREQVGVCRDFMHLAITLCRCLNVPARYCTGYLGDIGVPIAPSPMDFSAWFEVYLGGDWYAFDARNNTPRIGRILMARGRDAADVALTTAFGKTQLESFKVGTDQIG